MSPPASSHRVRPTPCQLSSKPPWRTPHHTLESTWGLEFLLTLFITSGNVWQIVSSLPTLEISANFPFSLHSLYKLYVDIEVYFLHTAYPSSPGFGYVSWIYDKFWKLFRSYCRQGNVIVLCTKRDLDHKFRIYSFQIFISAQRIIRIGFGTTTTLQLARS